jgi:hypothetical protein
MADPAGAGDGLDADALDAFHQAVERVRAFQVEADRTLGPGACSVTVSLSYGPASAPGAPRRVTQVDAIAQAHAQWHDRTVIEEDVIFAHGLLEALGWADAQ